MTPRRARDTRAGGRPRWRTRSSRRLAKPCSVDSAARSTSAIAARHRARSPSSVVVGGALLERLADAGLQLGRGRLGEGDRGDVGQSDAFAEHEVGDPIDQLGGLARSRAGLDEQRLGQPVAADEVARRPDRRGRSWFLASTPTASRRRSSGASTLISACSPRSRDAESIEVAEGARLVRAAPDVPLPRLDEEHPGLDAFDDRGEHLDEPLPALGRPRRSPVARRPVRGSTIQ